MEKASTIVGYESKEKYALINYKEYLSWYNLPFYKRWFTKKPSPKYISINVSKLEPKIIID